MTSSARTVFYFGIYLNLVGFAFLVVPNLLLGILQLPATDEVWIRVVGLLAGALGTYYILAARHEYIAIIQMTVYLRSTVILLFAAFVWLGYAELPLMMFGLVDFLGAIWTWWALRVEGRAA